MPLPPSAPAGPPEDHYRQFVEFGPDLMVMVSPNGRCSHVSPASVMVLGRPPAALVGVDLHELVLDPDRHILGDMLAQLGSGISTALASFRIYGAFGTWIWVEAAARRLPAGAGAVLALRDITARKEEEALLIEANGLLRRRTTEDAVTCLPNHGHFIASVEREVRRANRDGTALCFLAVGINDMRLFNDFYGRSAGDVALREVAIAVAGALCRPGDLAGRLKGAMLGVVLPNTDLAGAAVIAERLRRAVTMLKLEHAGAPTGRLTVTVGLACAEARAKVAALVQEAVCEVEVVRAASLSRLTLQGSEPG